MLSIAFEALAIRSPGDDQLRVGNLGQRGQHVPDAFALDQPADGEYAVPMVVARLHRPAGMEPAHVDAAGHDVDAPGITPEPEQLELLSA